MLGGEVGNRGSATINFFLKLISKSLSSFKNTWSGFFSTLLQQNNIFYFLGSGSFPLKHCTKEANTICQCRREFVPSDNDSSTCKCGIGFGLKHGGRVMDHIILRAMSVFQLIDYIFILFCQNVWNVRLDISAHLLIPSVKNGQSKFTAFHLKYALFKFCDLNNGAWSWKMCFFSLHSRCKSAGENITGTVTSDVICNEDGQNKNASPVTRVTPHPPHEGAQTQMRLTTTTTSAPGRLFTPGINSQPFSPSNPGNPFGKTFAPIVYDITFDKKGTLNNL